MGWSSEDLKNLLKELKAKEPKPESDQERFFKAFGVVENLNHRVEPALVYYWYRKWKERNNEQDILKKLTFFKVSQGFPPWVKRSNWSKTTMLKLDKKSFPTTKRILEEIQNNTQD